MSTLPICVTNKLWDFCSHEYFEINEMRTHLFSINCICKENEGMPDKESLDKVKRLISNYIDSKLDTILWKYLSLYETETPFCGDNKKGLLLNSDWLSMFFALKMLKSEILKEYIKDDIHGQEVSFYFFERLSSYLLYVVHLMRTHSTPNWIIYSDDTPESFMKAKLFLLSEYAHGDAGLPREVRIIDELDAIFSTEAILYTVRDSYREHLQHTIDCFLTGLFLLDVRFQDGRSLIQKIAPSYNVSTFLMQWIIAGLLHDVGYILDLCDHSAKHIAFLRYAPETKEYVTKIKTSLKEATLELLNSLNTKVHTNKKMEKLDHGVISAIHIFHMFKESNVEPSFLIDDCLRAILKHNLQGETVDPEKEPLAFLLLLCDHLQEWDRPRVDSLLFRKEVYQRLSSPIKQNFSNNTILKYMQTNISCGTAPCTFLVDAGLEFGLLYKDSGRERFEPIINWVTACYDFQKIEARQLKVPIKMCFVHPLAKELREQNPGFREFDLFQLFTRSEYSGATLASWVNTVKSNTFSEISYCNDETETCILRLDNFQHDKPVINQLPQDIYLNYKKWKEDHLKKTKLKLK